MTPSQDRVAELIQRLAVWCETTGREIDAAGRVDEETAAEIVGKAVGTLRNWRATSSPLPYYRGSPVRYAISDLALYIELQRTNDHEVSRTVTNLHGGR